MKNKIYKNIVLMCFFLSLIYFIASYILLNGKFIYETSFSSKNKFDSQKRGLFVTDKLNIKVEGDSLNLLLKNIDLWSEKHFIITYYGIIFNKTKEIKYQRKLMMKFKDNKKKDFICYNLICKKDTIKNSTEFPDNSYGVNINDTLIYNIYNCKNDQANRELGKLYIQIK